MNSTFNQLRVTLCGLCFQPVRFARHKPWLPKFRLLRQMQPWDGPVDLGVDRLSPVEEETPMALRARMRRNGFLPPPIFQEFPINISHTGQVVDPFKPPAGDGRSSLLSATKKALNTGFLLEKGKTYRETLRIRQHEPSFNAKQFASEAETIYREAHDLLPNFAANEDRLFQLVTEKAFAEMTRGLKFRTLRWQFVSSIEPPRVVHVRTHQILGPENIYGQVTVRFHTEQILAIFDRFGRLLFGNPAVPVDVLEYVVLEKHITDEYGLWRLHAKILPPDAPPMGTFIPTHPLIADDNKEQTNQKQIAPSESAVVPH